MKLLCLTGRLMIWMEHSAQLILRCTIKLSKRTQPAQLCLKVTRWGARPLNLFSFFIILLLFQQINTTVPIVKIPNLETGKKYRFFVVSRNEKGTSLPSSIITLTVSSEGWTGKPIEGASSPPHLLEVESHSATWLQFAWNPPAITHPEDLLKYRYVVTRSLIVNFRNWKLKWIFFKVKFVSRHKLLIYL